nr:PREDICTED: uncharacterized protein LOC105662886 [Megachile rotundata]
MDSQSTEKPMDSGSDVKTSVSVKKKRPDRASRKRTTEAFRERVGVKQQQERRQKIFRKYDLLNADALELERTLTNMSLTVQSYAVLLIVSTWGVRFAATIEYSRMRTTWNLRAIVEICTIHQYYRVCLYLFFFFLF